MTPDELRNQIAQIDEKMANLWRKRTNLAAQLSTRDRLEYDHDVATFFARKMGRRIGAAFADLLRVAVLLQQNNLEKENDADL